MGERRTRGYIINYRQLACLESDSEFEQCDSCRHSKGTRKRKAREATGTTATPDSKTAPLYPVSVLRRESGRAFIHYIGYEPEFDERQDESQIDEISSLCLQAEEYDLHQDLAIRVKSALTSKRKGNPVNISMPFNKQTFGEGLMLKGTIKKVVRAVKYNIKTYADLDELFGRNWHFMGLNAAGDYCYVISNTLEYYLYKRRLLKHCA